MFCGYSIFCFRLNRILGFVLSIFGLLCVFGRGFFSFLSFWVWGRFIMVLYMIFSFGRVIDRLVE